MKDSRYIPLLIRLISKRKTHSFSTAKPFSSRKLKKPLFFKLFTGVALSAVLIVPLFAQASVRSFFTSLLRGPVVAADTQIEEENSQTMSVLAPAINLDPNPAKGGGDITVVGGAALAAQDGPGGTPKSDEKPQSSQISVYTVRSGDTLSEIAEMFDVSVNTIIWANDIKGRAIQPGQVLIILPINGIRYIVEKGETLASIAKKYKGDVNEIASYNELMVDAELVAGAIVIIPNGEVPAPSTTVKSKTVAKKSPSSSAQTAPLKGAGGPSYDGYYLWPVAGGALTKGSMDTMVLI